LRLTPRRDARARERASLRHVLEVARRASYKTVELEVRRSNLAAQALYRSFKFEQVGMRARYYEDNDEDAILMTLRLRE